MLGANWYRDRCVFILKEEFVLRLSTTRLGQNEERTTNNKQGTAAGPVLFFVFLFYFSFLFLVGWLVGTTEARQA